MFEVTEDIFYIGVDDVDLDLSKGNTLYPTGFLITRTYVLTGKSRFSIPLINAKPQNG